MKKEPIRVSITNQTNEECHWPSLHFCTAFSCLMLSNTYTHTKTVTVSTSLHGSISSYQSGSICVYVLIIRAQILNSVTACHICISVSVHAAWYVFFLEITMQKQMLIKAIKVIFKLPLSQIFVTTLIAKMCVYWPINWYWIICLALDGPHRICGCRQLSGRSSADLKQVALCKTQNINQSPPHCACMGQSGVSYSKLKHYGPMWQYAKDYIYCWVLNIYFLCLHVCVSELGYKTGFNLKI